MELIPQSKYSLIMKEYNYCVDLHIGVVGGDRSCSTAHAISSVSVPEHNISIDI